MHLKKLLLGYAPETGVFFMDHISNVIKKSKLANNVTIVNVNNSNNVNSDNNVISSKVGKYALNRDSFTPNTPETKLAEDIATSFADINNYAFYLYVVKQLGVARTHEFWRGIQEEVKEKLGSRFEIRSPKKYFAWKFKKGHR